ncbi:breast cancer anti-estrogen resistance protein 1 isoform X2 [Ischnura elegans]|uniref:breast cancer anti-estrogen resistance protein 1 isoform X2 n=1 Tax=Ischnura elegans TaxID=197161 RepID=UPI001ED896A8|nr:breast cancer anti-estrogen resistance protein 1 isoform X2 [Ischnura elegans]
MPQPPVETIITPQNCVARALYDNIAESPDELAFRKGDLLTVLEQNTAGIEGWWLCSLRGRQGICPGNRLRLLAGVFDSSSQQTILGNMVQHQSLGGGSLTASSSNPGTGTAMDSMDLNTLQRQGKRRSWHVQPNKVVTPQKFGDVYLYDMPPGACRQQMMQQQGGQYDVPPPPTSVAHQAGKTGRAYRPTGDVASALDSYDVPRPSATANYDVPRAWRHPGAPSPSSQQTQTPPSSSTPDRRDSVGESYDVPRPHNHAAVLLQQTTAQLQALQIQQGQAQGTVVDQGEYDVPASNRLTPSSSASSLTAADSFSSSNRSSLECGEQQRRRILAFPDAHYDVPRPLPHPPAATRQSPPPGDASLLYDAPQPQPSEPSPPANQPPAAAVIDAKKQYVLPLELGAALETLARLQEEALTSISRLLAFVSPKWRSRERMDARAVELSLAASRVAAALRDLLAFADAALGNAAKAADPGIATKLRILVRALRDGELVVREANAALGAGGWSPALLSRPDDESPTGEGPTPPPDALDRLIAAARALTEDVRRVGSFIQGNGTLLFQRTAPPASSDWLEDYDYVNLESKESVAKQNAEIREALPDALRKSYDLLVREAEEAAVGRSADGSSPLGKGGQLAPGSNGHEPPLHPDDLRVLQFYAPQSVEHVNYLTRAIDAFLLTVEHNQPPKVFLAHGKFVVLSAHRLVGIGDSVHRGVTTEVLRNRVIDCANALSKALEATVQKTKRAAMHFPSVSAVQEMVDSVVDVSHLARDLKVTLVTSATGMSLVGH